MWHQINMALVEISQEYGIYLIEFQAKKLAEWDVGQLPIEFSG